MNHPDPLIQVGLEEGVLSSMMGTPDHPGAKVTELQASFFTSRLRGRMYEMLSSGIAYKLLEARLYDEGFSRDDISYVSDIYLTPAYSERALPDAVKDVQRLAMLRVLCEAVDGWRRGAPYMEFDRAMKELDAAIRKSGVEIFNGRAR